MAQMLADGCSVSVAPIYHIPSNSGYQISETGYPVFSVLGTAGYANYEDQQYSP